MVTFMGLTIFDTETTQNCTESYIKLNYILFVFSPSDAKEKTKLHTHIYMHRHTN